VNWFAASTPVVKGSTSTSRGRLEQIPEYLRELRKADGFDYGRFDYTEVDGEVHLFDMNKTSALGDLSRSLISEETLLAFANAIYHFD